MNKHCNFVQRLLEQEEQLNQIKRFPINRKRLSYRANLPAPNGVLSRLARKSEEVLGDKY